jgi:hypothetical protein
MIGWGPLVASERTNEGERRLIGDLLSTNNDDVKGNWTWTSESVTERAIGCHLLKGVLEVVWFCVFSFGN